MQTNRFTTKRGRTMTTSPSTHRRVRARQQRENRRDANAWKTGTVSRQAVGQWNQRDNDARVVPAREHLQIGPVEQPHKDLESSVFQGDVFAFLTLLAWAVAVISVTVYVAQYVLSEISSNIYTTMDVIRMLGGMP